MNPILIGYRCCGKTSTGRLLADLTGYTFVDTDQYIETRYEARIQDLVERNGWDWFRRAESRALKETAVLPDQVIATGGGMVLAPGNRDFMRENGFVVWLTADPETIVRRLEHDPENEASRPRFTDGSILAETRDILAQRMPLYRDVSQFIIDTTCHSPEAAARLILKEI